MLIVAVALAAAPTGCAIEDPSAAPPVTVKVSEPCAASIEAMLDAHVANPQMPDAASKALSRLTLTACPTALEWQSAAIKYPNLTGITDVDGPYSDRLWQVHCYENQDTPACTNARERGLYEIPVTDPPSSVGLTP